MAFKILAVDDELNILSLIQNCLADEKYNITCASTLANARMLLANELFDLIIIDIGLTDGSGLDFVQKIRTHFLGGIIILSGRNDMVDRVLGIELGADDYIVKPFHLRDFRARIGAVHRRLLLVDADLLTQGKNSIRFFGFEMDTQKRSVKIVDGDELHLTTREFDVLRILVENHEKVVTRDYILSSVFGSGHHFGGRPVDGLVSRLRDKLFPDGSGHLRLKTVRGRGYQLTY